MYFQTKIIIISMITIITIMIIIMIIIIFISHQNIKLVSDTYSHLEVVMIAIDYHMRCVVRKTHSGGGSGCGENSTQLT